jgi:hypothetical protein
MLTWPDYMPLDGFKGLYIEGFMGLEKNALIG